MRIALFVRVVVMFTVYGGPFARTIPVNNISSKCIRNPDNRVQFYAAMRHARCK